MKVYLEDRKYLSRDYRGRFKSGGPAFPDVVFKFKNRKSPIKVNTVSLAAVVLSAIFVIIYRIQL